MSGDKKGRTEQSKVVACVYTPQCFGHLIAEPCKGCGHCKLRGVRLRGHARKWAELRRNACLGWAQGFHGAGLGWVWAGLGCWFGKWTSVCPFRPRFRKFQEVVRIDRQFASAPGGGRFWMGFQ